MDQIIEYFSSLNPVVGALYATLFTWGVTALGASTVFLFKTMSRMALDGMLGFTGGVMVAASFWSLLFPAIEMSAGDGFIKVMPAAIGFGLGALFIFGVDKVLPHIHINFKEPEGIKTPWRRTTLLTLQNFPEGIAVAMPLRRSGLSKRKSFWYGQLSAIVEPVAGVIGALAVTFFTPILPYALAFAAGAMIFVVVEEVIPETQLDKYTDIATLGFIGGFIIMMTLDVALG